MIKRIISILIVLLLACQVIVIQAGSNTTGIEYFDNSSYELSQEFLEALGLDVNDFFTEYSDNITRGQAAKIIADLLNLDYKNSTIKRVFADVDESSPFIKEIEAIASLGIVRGDSDRNYKPEEKLTFEQTLNMFLRITGHYIVAEADGYSFGSTLAVANKLDLIENVHSTTGNIIIGDFFVIAYNALHTEVFEKTLSSTPTYKQSETTLLYDLYGVVYQEGIITKNDVTTLWASTDMLYGEVCLSADSGNIIIKDSVNGVLRDEIGKRVRIYYNYDKTIRKNNYVFHEIINYDSISQYAFEELYLDNCSFQNRKLVYSDESSLKTKTIEFANDCAFIYNNMYFAEGTFDFNSLDGKSGYVTLIDNTGDTRIDVLKISDYNTFLIGDIGADYDVIYDKSDVKNYVSLAEDDYIYISIKDKDGNSVLPEMLTADMLVSVAKSSESTKDKCVEILVSDKFVSGGVTEIISDDFYKEIVLDNMDTYKVLKKCESAFDLRNEITAYIDVFGRIGHIELASGRNWKYGIMLKYGNTGSGLSPKFAARIIGIDASIKNYYFADEFMIDKIKYKTSEYALAQNALDGADDLTFDTVDNALEGVKVVRYKTDSEDFIKEIDTTNVEDEGAANSITLMGCGIKPCIDAKMFGFTIPYKSDAKILNFSTSDYTSADDLDDELIVNNSTASSSFKRNVKYTIAAYKWGENEVYSDFIIMVSEPNITAYDNSFFTISRMSKGISETTGEVMNCVTGYTMGAEKKFFIENNFWPTFEAANYVNGDVIRFVTNGKGEISDVATVVKIGSDGNFADVSYTEKYPPKETTTASVTMLAGAVYQKENSILRVSKDATCKNLTTVYDVYITPGAKVTVVENNARGLMVRAGSIADIKSYLHDSTGYSKILMRYRSSALKEIVIWNLK